MAMERWWGFPSYSNTLVKEAVVRLPVRVAQQHLTVLHDALLPALLQDALLLGRIHPEADVHDGPAEQALLRCPLSSQKASLTSTMTPSSMVVMAAGMGFRLKHWKKRSLFSFMELVPVRSVYHS